MNILAINKISRKLKMNRFKMLNAPYSNRYALAINEKIIDRNNIMPTIFISSSR